MYTKYLKPKDKLKFVFSTEALTNLVNDTMTAKAGGGTPASKLKGLNYLQYSDYISIFLFIDLINTNTENKVLERMSDVIGRNVGVAKGYSNENDDVFNMDNADTYYRFTAKIQIDPLLLSLPLLSDERYNKSSSVSWWEWDYSITRGYN